MRKYYRLIIFFFFWSTSYSQTGKPSQSNNSKEWTDADLIAEGSSYGKCHLKKKWNKSKVRNQLLGKWTIQFIQCFWSPHDGNFEKYKGLTVVFTKDSIILQEIGKQPVAAIWKIEPRKGNIIFTIETDPFIYWTKGFILFCDDKVEFFNSWIDGCDYLFKKT